MSPAQRLIADTIRERRRGAIIWILGGAAVMVVMALALESELARFEGGREALAASVQAGAEAMRLLRWPAERLDTLGGYITYHNVTLFAYFLSVYALVQGCRAIRGAETTQVLEPVLATGRPRTAVLLERAIGFGIVLLTIAVGLGAGLTLAMAMGGEPNAVGSFLTAVACGICAFVAYALGVAVSQLIGTARSAAGVVALAVTVLYLLTNIWDRIGALGVIRFVSPFYYFGQSRALVPGHGFSISAAVTSLAMSVALLGLAAWAFERRDVGAPLWVRRPGPLALPTRVQRPALRRLWSAILLRERTGLLVWVISAGFGMGLMAWLEPNVIDVWSKFGFTKNLSAIDPRFSPTDQYLSFAAEILAPILAALVVTRAAAWIADLDQGRVEIILSTPLSWARLVAQRLIALLVEAALVIVGAVAGLVIVAVAVGANVRIVGVLRLAATTYLLAVALGALAALLVAWLRTNVAVTAMSILFGASYVFLLLVLLFGWPDWLAKLSLFGAIGHPYLRAPPVEGLVFLAVLAIVSAAAAAAVAQRSPKVR
ncbi:ABC transporter permease subunit [Mycolicibacterium chubuense]|nr:ABC transporter permease subunit [Mycolicibacterium chubuense]